METFWEFIKADSYSIKETGNTTRDKQGKLLKEFNLINKEGEECATAWLRSYNVIEGNGIGLKKIPRSFLAYYYRKKYEKYIGREVTINKESRKIEKVDYIKNHWCFSVKELTNWYRFDKYDKDLGITQDITTPCLFPQIKAIDVSTLDGFRKNMSSMEKVTLNVFKEHFKNSPFRVHYNQSYKQITKSQILHG